MQRIRINQIIERIQRKETFEATDRDKSFIIKIRSYVPFCCTAIHHGSNLRPELEEKIAVDNYERWYEEDPHTGDFINALPITLIGLDSRFEYDLNRSPEKCIYEEAWGKKIWKKNLTRQERKISLQKHANFYRVVHELIKKLIELFSACVVYDIHSYNYKRWNRSVPLFNIGTERVDNQRFGPFIQHWNEQLAAIRLTDIAHGSRINDTFFGRGYQLSYITTHFPDALTLATEVKKVYCNEETGEDYPKVINELQQKMKEAVLSNAYYFSQRNTPWTSQSAGQLLDKTQDSAITEVDKRMFQLLQGFEFLSSVNPINAATEEKRFFRSRYTRLPQFKYDPVKVDPFQLKKELSMLHIQRISDVSIRHLYESVINSYINKIDMVASINTEPFLYNSLRYFGRPDKNDLRNAQYLLHLPRIPTEPRNRPFVYLEEAIKYFKNALKEYNIKCKIEVGKRTVSPVMVLNLKKTILFNPDAKFTQIEIESLIEHEVGVHVVTTENAIRQPLKILHLGLPVNTMTQEGLAILSEYASGNITLQRLKELAQRVVVVDMMCNGADFIECFRYLTDHHEATPNDAYAMVTRVFRGGGFTKDYLYLNGFVKILQMWQKAPKSLYPLMVGKTSLEFYDIIEEMIERDMIERPIYLTKSLVKPHIAKNNTLYEYIISGLKPSKT